MLANSTMSKPLGRFGRLPSSLPPSVLAQLEQQLQQLEQDASVKLSAMGMSLTASGLAGLEAAVEVARAQRGVGESAVAESPSTAAYLELLRAVAQSKVLPEGKPAQAVGGSGWMGAESFPESAAHAACQPCSCAHIDQADSELGYMGDAQKVVSSVSFGKCCAPESSSADAGQFAAAPIAAPIGLEDMPESVGGLQPEEVRLERLPITNADTHPRPSPFPSPPHLIPSHPVPEDAHESPCPPA